MPRFSPSGFFGPSRVSPDPWAQAHIWIPHMCSVCVCVCVRIVYTHLHPHTLPPALEIEKTQTTPLSLLLSKITPHAKQQVPSYISWTPPSSFPNSEWTNFTYTNAYAHPVANMYGNVYADVHNTWSTFTAAHAWYSQHLSKRVRTLRKKCTCTRACAPIQRYRSFFAMEAIANLSWVLREHCAGCRLPSALFAVSTKPVARRCSLKRRHLGSSTAANWVSFDLNVSCSSCWGYSLINTLKLKKNNN